MRLLLALTVHLPALVAGWLFVLIFYGWATQDLKLGKLMDEPLMLTSTWRNWVVKRRGKSGWRFWKYTTTIGRGWIKQPGRDSDVRLKRHEETHVRQGADLSFLALVLGAVTIYFTGDWKLGIALWCTGWAWQLPNFVTAAMRYGLSNGYRYSGHEVEAYALTNIIVPADAGMSWAQIFEERREEARAKTS